MSNKKTSERKKRGRMGLIRDEISKGYAECFRNKRRVMSGETYRSRKRTRPEKPPSHYKARY